jgi:IS1 family transposase
MLRFYRHSWHQPVGKESGLTSYIERLNNTLRQRISRLVRKTLSFSKKLENHGWCYLDFYSWLQSPNPISNAEDSTASIFSLLYIKALPFGYRDIRSFAKSNQKLSVKTFHITTDKVPSYSTIWRAMMLVKSSDLTHLINGLVN